MRCQKVGPDGITAYAAMKQIEKATGKTPSGLIPPDLPEQAFYIWTMFAKMSRMRSVGMGVPGPILFSEIESWARLNEITFTAFELDMFSKLDNLWMTIVSED